MRMESSLTQWRSRWATVLVAKRSGSESEAEQCPLTKLIGAIVKCYDSSKTDTACIFEAPKKIGQEAQ